MAPVAPNAATSASASACRCNVLSNMGSPHPEKGNRGDDAAAEMNVATVGGRIASATSRWRQGEKSLSPRRDRWPARTQCALNSPAVHKGKTPRQAAFLAEPVAVWISAGVR
jgi:hypothetical protein